MNTHPSGVDRFLATLSEVLQQPVYVAAFVLEAATAGAVRWWLGEQIEVLVGLFDHLPAGPGYFSVFWMVPSWFVHQPFFPTFFGYLCALGPLVWSASSFWHPGTGWIWQRCVGAFDPSKREARKIRDAIVALGPEAVEGLGELHVYVIDRSEPFAFVRGNALIVSRGLVESEFLMAVLAHELSHARSIDGRLIQALDRLALWGDPLARVRDEDTFREFGGVAALFVGALRWTLRAAGGTLTLRLLSPLLALHWRKRERVADEAAVALDQGPALAEHLKAWVLPTDRPHPRLLFNLQQHERTPYRLDILVPDSAL